MLAGGDLAHFPHTYTVQKTLPKEYFHLQWVGLSPSINVIKMMTYSHAQRSISWLNNTNHYSGQVNFQKVVKTTEREKGSVGKKSPWGN